MGTVIVTAIGSFSANIVIKKCRENGIRVIDCDVYPRKQVADAGSVEAFYQVPYATDTDHYIETAMSLCRKEGVEAVIPLTDAEIDVFSLHRDGFSEVSVTLCMSGKTCIDLCHDKMKLYRCLKGYVGGTAIPTLRPGDADPDEIRYPAVYEPYSGRSSQGLKIVGSHREMEGILREADPTDYIVQPMTKGNVAMMDVVQSPEQGTCAAIYRGELLRTPSGARASVLVFRNRQLEERYRAVARLLEIRGCVNMESIEGRDGVYHVLECNPRFSGSMEFSCLTGYDCVANHLHCFEGKGTKRDGSVTGVYIAREYEEYITKVER